MVVKNTITFDPTTEECSVLDHYPTPSKKHIPDWYKKIPGFSNGDNKLRFPLDYGMPNSTLKKCVPFLDAMSSGYTVSLEEDVYVELVNKEPFIRWRSKDTLITWHTPDQFPNFPIPNNYHNMVAKWKNDWTIMVPKNYSVLFSHPSNRIDLPFFTFSGLVSCDRYSSPVQYPFILQKEFEGIIEAGTPICQLTIVKNESWKTKVLKFDKHRTYKNSKHFYKTFTGSYKKNFWTRHNYE